MEIPQGYLDRFKVVPPKSEAQGRQWERADAVLEAMKFLHFSEVYQLTSHLEPHQIVLLIDKAKKEGEKPKAYFRYLVNEQKNEKVIPERSEV